MSLRPSLLSLAGALAAGMLVTAAVAAPKSKPAPQQQQQVPEPVMKEAKDLFEMRCASCHGATGGGDGPAAAALTPGPRNFADPQWQKSVTDAHIEKIIVEGVPAVGKSPLMPPNPDLAGKPVVAGLRAYIRSLSAAKKP